MGGMDMEHLTAVCTGLGTTREDEDEREVYVKHPDCLVNLKNLQRFLRRDDPTSREIFMQLGKWNTIRQDILPIIIHYRHSYDLVLNAVKVMVFLTMPVDPSSSNITQQLEYLHHFKAAVLENDAIGVIVSHLQDPLEHMESGTLTDMDGKMFQLMLTLIRNLLAVDDISSPLVRASTISSTHASYIKDELLERLFKENVMDLLLALTQHVGGEQPFLRHDNLLILEVLHYLFSGQSPDIIASSGDRGQKQSKPDQTSSAILEVFISKEKVERRARDFSGPRHSNFCGTFVRVERDGTKTLLTRNPYQSPLDNLFQKPEIKRGQVKKVAVDLPLHMPSNSTVCGLLKGLADQLLDGNYNLLMQTVKQDIQSERNSVQSHDLVMFFTVANFFTAYQRSLLLTNQLSGNAQQGEEKINQNASEGAVFQGRCGRIASTMDEDMFTLVTVKWQSFVEGAKVNNDWFPPTSAGLLIKEMIHMLDYVLKAANRNTADGQQEVRVARILLYKVFYDHTEHGILPFIFRLIKTFDVHKQPRSQLAGLIETTHIVLRLLDCITKEDGALRVKTKARNFRKKDIKASQKQTTHPDVPTEKDQDKPSGDEIDPGVPLPKNIKCGPLAPESNKFHTAEAVGNATTILTGEAQSYPQELIENGAVLDGQRATDKHVPPSEERLKSREIAGVPLTETDRVVGDEGMVETKIRDLEDLGAEEVEDEGETDEDTENSSGEDEEVKTKEETLDVLKCVKMFADNTVLHNYCWLLKNYVHNTAATNYYIIRMLQRICHDCMLEPMLYQLSMLQIFYEILSINSMKNSEQHQFAIAFLTKVVRHLFLKLKKSPMLFVDLLFWKAKQDCHCITADYMIHDLQKSTASKGKPVKMAVNFQDRRALLNSLGDDDDDDNDMDNVASAQTLFGTHKSDVGVRAGEKGKVKRQKVQKQRGPFSDFEEDLIKDLFEKHKEDRSCVKLVAQGLFEAGAIQDSGDQYSPYQVGQALKRLGLERVVKKKSTSKVLQNIGSDDTHENHDGKSSAGRGADIDTGSAGDKVADELAEVHKVFSARLGPKKRKGLFVSMEEDSDKEERKVTADSDSGRSGDNVDDKAATIRKVFSARLGFKKRKGMLESNKENSDKEEREADDAPVNLGDNRQKSSRSERTDLKKRKNDDSITEGGSNVPKRRRKSGIFSEEQDHELQSLFEKYKGMTRFRHLISHDLEGVFTPAQIGRRLRQLGCFEPKKRKSILAEMSDEAEKESPDSGDSESDDDLPIGQHLLLKSALRIKKRLQPVEEHGKDSGCDGKECRDSEGDDNQPIALTISTEKCSGRPQFQQELEINIAVKKSRSIDLSVEDDQAAKKASTCTKRPGLEQELDTEVGRESIKAGETHESGESDNDDLPISHQLALKKRPQQVEAVLTEATSHVSRLRCSEMEIDHVNVEPVAVTEGFERNMPLSYSPRKSFPRAPSSGDMGDEEIGVMKKTYKRKRSPKFEQKSTWGDSDTDASDVDDLVLLGVSTKTAKNDLISALQEVQEYEKYLETRTKKRRLERKHNLNETEMDAANDKLIPNTPQQQADGGQPEPTAAEGQLMCRKGARRTMLHAMESDDEE